MVKRENKNLPEFYFYPRDFEIVQPLYDMAFLLDIVAIAQKQPPPKYRIFSLFQAAHALDSYTSSVYSWLDGSVGDEELPTIPSSRIRHYLEEIRASGTIEELSLLRREKAASGCLRLRSIRGLSSKYIARLFSNKKTPPSTINELAQRSGITPDEVFDVFKGNSYLSWQAAHILPPLFRFLNGIESVANSKTKFEISSIENGVDPICHQFCVLISLDPESLKKAVFKVLKREPFFKISTVKDALIIEHLMGWSFEICPEQPVEHSRIMQSLHTHIFEFDPLAGPLPTWVKADLHTHTYWSDGIASAETMSRASFALGLEYFAVTDHSRSSKLQNGMGISDWLKQDYSFQHSAFTGKLLHGLEVDILRDGSLDLPGRFLGSLEMVIASVHSIWSKHENENTRRLIRAIESGNIDILGHPSAAMLGKPGIPSYRRQAPPVNWKEVIDCCAKWKVALEINCFPSRLDIRGTLLDHAISAGCWIAFGSDAHSPYHLPLLKFAPAIIAQSKAGAPQILNKLSYKQLKGWLDESRQYRNSLTRTNAKPVQEDLFESSSKLNSSGTVKIRISKTHILPKGSRIIGMDLVASEEKKTGVAILSECNAVVTLSLKTDEELIRLVEEQKPSIVSIDSPLGLPGGGNQIDPDAGIVRFAEYDLYSVGIPAYPALIDSMESLTLRGVRIARLLRQLSYGPTVIESYPGSAQDILGIPRKQRGLNLLREGLTRIGVSGVGLETTSHDELDAITSAVVGRFYETGQYEPMGILKEAQLIVPVIPTIQFDKQLIIYMAGKNGSGKSVVSRYLALFYGFKWIKTRDIIMQLIVDDFEGLATNLFDEDMLSRDQVTDKHLGEFGRIILEKYGQAPLNERLKHAILSETGPIVVDAIRSNKDIEGIDLGDAVTIIWFVHSTNRSIEQRCRIRGDRKNKHIENLRPMDQNIDQLHRLASSVIPNHDSLENLRRTVDDFLFEYLEVIK